MAKKKLDEAIEGLDEIKRKQVLAELATIRLQYRIAILGIIGSSIAFFVIQQNNIKALFTSDPRVFYTSNESFVQDKALVSIRDSKGDLKARSEVKNIGKGFELLPGSYTSTIQIDTQQIWQESFVIAANETRKIILPEFYTNVIRVYVKNNTASTSPGRQIDVEISASGNGYLWIYELVNEKESKLLFPDDPSANKHVIQSGETFSFPDGLSLFTGKEIKQERYIFLVTSLNDESFANSIMNMLYAKTITKGEVKDIDQNWGYQEISVQVAL